MAKKKKPPIKIVAYQADWGACYGYRLYFPLNTLKDKHEDLFKVDIKQLMTMPDMMAADIVILARQVNAKVFANAINIRAEAGTKIIYETDDNFIDVPEWNPAHEFVSDPRVQQNFRVFLEECDAIVVSTEDLKKTYSQFNDNVWVCPNSIWPEKTICRPRNNKMPVVGWAGSGSHHGDFKRIEPTLDELDRRGDVMLKMMWKPDYTGEHVYQVPWVQWADYYVTLACADFDVGLAPLEDHKFNLGKSNIRYIEYSMAGTPIIASNVGPFADCIEHEKTGILINNDEEWLPAIDRLLRDRDFADQMTDNAYQDVLSRYNIHENYKKWRELLRTVHNMPKRTTTRNFTLREETEAQDVTASHPATQSTAPRLR